MIRICLSSPDVHHFRLLTVSLSMCTIFGLPTEVQCSVSVFNPEAQLN